MPLRAFVRDPGKAAAVLGPDVELAVGDVAEPASSRAALDGTDVVFLACGNVLGGPHDRPPRRLPGHRAVHASTGRRPRHPAEFLADHAALFGP